MTDQGQMQDRYRRAESMCEWNVRRVVRNASIRPEWVDGGRSVRWRRQRSDGTDQTVQVVTATGERTVLSTSSDGASRAEMDAHAPVPDGHLRSPDRRHDVVVVDGDLWVERVVDGVRFRLTDDAEPLHDYASSPQSSTTWLSTLRSGVVASPVAVWSPDGSRVLTHRLDQRSVPELSLLEMRPAEGHRPRRWTYRMPFMGDELATAQLIVVDVREPERPVVHQVGDPLLVEFVSPLELGWVWWADDARQVWFLRETRGASSLTLCRADPDGAEVHEVLTESAEDYVEPHPLLPWPATVPILRSGTIAVWPSERDGWRHLYAVDVDSGQVARQLTAGDWSVREVLHSDDRWVWFTACGREAGRDPYFRHLYRVPLDGGAVELLTPEDADHAVDVAPDGSCFVDTASTIATAPVARLRRDDGRLVAELERADLSGLEALGWRPPERFCVPAADGTDLYGVIYLPSDFDPEQRYPVLDSWYPGPQLIRTPKSFTVDDDAGVDAWPGPWGAQAIAELGVVVVNVDGRGTPLRSRDFHHATYARLQEHAIDDHTAAVDALASTRPWMDVGRLGAQGHSAGAAATVRALLVRPDRYRMGIAGSAVNDLRRYIAYWGEKYQGLLGTFDEDAQSNLTLADRLEGYLLMLHGELDDNVHPSNTFAMYDAFVRADKDVDLVVLAGESHPCWRHPYYVRRSWDAVCRHLIGVAPPSGYRVAPPPEQADGPGW